MRDCNISSRYEYPPYLFKIYGKATLESSKIGGMGSEGMENYWWYIEEGGLQIYSDDVAVRNCTIMNPYTGIYCMGSSPLIHNNTIIDNYYIGINCYNSNATISENAILSNYYYGIYVESTHYYWNYEPVIEGNMISDSKTGIYVNYAMARISNNTISDNSDGIEIYSSKVTITDNVLIENYRSITDQNSNSGIIADNLITQNNYGITLSQSIYNITRNEIVNNNYGIKIGDRNYQERSISFIENNIVSNNSYSGILVYSIYPIIRNNTIGNNSEWGIYIFEGDAQIEDNIYYYDNRSNGKGRIVNKIPLTVRVKDSGGRYIENVNMKITSSNGTVIANENLRSGYWSSNYFGRQTPILYIWENNGSESSIDYSIEVEKEGITNSTLFMKNSPDEVTLVLHLLPDLEVMAIEVGRYFPWFNDGRSPKEGDNITVRIHVYNQGNGTAFDTKVRTFIDGDLENEQVIPKINSKSTEKVFFQWKARPGNITFEVTIDPDNSIEELVEDNNHGSSYRSFESLPPDLTPVNTFLIIIFIFLVITFIFWIRWRYEVWRRH